MAAVHPGKRADVETALAAWLHDAMPDATLRAPIDSPGDGLSTFIWFFEPTGDHLSPGWNRPLVLRIFSTPTAGPLAQTEADVHAYVRRHGYPAPEMLHLETDAQRSPFGLPFVVMARAPGRVMLRLATAQPWRMPRLLRSLGVVHEQLHRIVVEDDCPLPYESPLVQRRLADLTQKIDTGGHDDARPGLAWLTDHAEMVSEEEPTFLHNDFHALNGVVDPTVRSQTPGNGVVVIDWSDASVGDVHHDVARTLAVFRVAAIAANNAAERVLLTRYHPWMARTYLSAYESARGTALAPERLRYWQALHVLRGWLQVREIHLPPPWAADRTLTSQATQVPARFGDELLAWFDELSGRQGQ